MRLYGDGQYGQCYYGGTDIDGASCAEIMTESIGCRELIPAADDPLSRLSPIDCGDGTC